MCMLCAVRERICLTMGVGMGVRPQQTVSQLEAEGSDTGPHSNHKVGSAP